MAARSLIRLVSSIERAVWGFEQVFAGGGTVFLQILNARQVRFTLTDIDILDLVDHRQMLQKLGIVAGKLRIVENGRYCPEAPSSRPYHGG